MRTAAPAGVALRQSARRAHACGWSRLQPLGGRRRDSGTCYTGCRRAFRYKVRRVCRRFTGARSQSGTLALPSRGRTVHFHPVCFSEGSGPCPGTCVVAHYHVRRRRGWTRKSGGVWRGGRGPGGYRGSSRCVSGVGNRCPLAQSGPLLEGCLRCSPRSRGRAGKIPRAATTCSERSVCSVSPAGRRHLGDPVSWTNHRKARLGHLCQALSTCTPCRPRVPLPVPPHAGAQPAMLPLPRGKGCPYFAEQ